MCVVRLHLQISCLITHENNYLGSNSFHTKPTTLFINPYDDCTNIIIYKYNVTMIKEIHIIVWIVNKISVGPPNCIYQCRIKHTPLYLITVIINCFILAP